MLLASGCICTCSARLQQNYPLITAHFETYKIPLQLPPAASGNTGPKRMVQSSRAPCSSTGRHGRRQLLHAMTSTTASLPSRQRRTAHTGLLYRTWRQHPGTGCGVTCCAIQLLPQQCHAAKIQLQEYSAWKGPCQCHVNTSCHKTARSPLSRMVCIGRAHEVHIKCTGTRQARPIRGAQAQRSC